ncbi:hypothetical protein [Falsirhodobacter sp. 20TX0035]|uniref:hypothetical protein n=1 Tax=Falsirhodobacter sp. 20TX0035 TaxID=3022019 RepID=UPI00232DFF23|nr:hypothetical protein [Falsirhodobacter sp. 20TX0035]MDB6452513.1 hypothetical protein [Falsirhodobacter sp. 20TX0035]
MPVSLSAPRLASLTFTLLCATALSNAAFAQSACDSSASGVTCSGSGTGLVDKDLDDAILTVQPGAQVEAEDAQAFRFGDGVTLVNAGTVRSAFDHAIQGGDDATVTNSGTIESTGKDGINLNAGARVGNAGVITATDDGIQTEGAATIINIGAITGGAAGVKAEGDDAVVINAAGATITAGEDGIRIEGLRGLVSNEGTVTSGEDGIKIDDDNGIVQNIGTITAGRFDTSGAVLVEGDGIQTENNGLVLNRGTIGASKDGVNVGDNSGVANYGTITGADDGVQIGVDSTFYNDTTGTVVAVGEGINANEDGILVTNLGTIRAGDDAINAGRNATIENSGTILSDGGEQDGIDLDSGTVENTGTILALGSQDGIDFDPSTDASTVTNSGRIEGAIGINTDPADTGAQTVINSGTITGRDGTALNLGAGDDRLVLNDGSQIDGTIEMGEGADTLEVTYATFDRLTLGSAVETVTTAGAALVGTSAIVLLDEDALRAEDRDTQALAYGLSRQILLAPMGEGLWAAGRGQDGESGSSLALGVTGYDMALGGGTAGAFLSLSKSGDVTAKVAGLRFGVTNDRLTAVAMAFAGQTEGEDIAGTAGAEGDIAGVAGRVKVLMRAPEAGQIGFDLAAEGGWSRNALDGYDLSRLDTDIDSRDVDSRYIRAEAGVPVVLGGTDALRGYVAVTRMDGDADDITARFDGQAITIEGAGLDRTVYGLGASWSRQFAGDAVLDAQVEASFGNDTENDIALGVSFRMPLGR